MDTASGEERALSSFTISRTDGGDHALRIGGVDRLTHQYANGVAIYTPQLSTAIYAQYVYMYVYICK
jgi:hypothetical protein